MKPLKKFLKKHQAYSYLYKVAENLTLEQFLDTCEIGDWILWLFRQSNPESLRELALAKGHCANTVRHLMIDPRSRNAVDMAIKFGEGKATKEELDKATDEAYVAETYTHAYSAMYSRHAARIAVLAANTTKAFGASGTLTLLLDTLAGQIKAKEIADKDRSIKRMSADAAAYEAGQKASQKQTADICRKYLPLHIWNIK